MTKALKAAALAATFVATALFTAQHSASAAVSSAAQQPVRFQMETRMYDIYHPFELDGRMNLTIYPSGIVSGFYIPSDGPVRNVTGGLRGENVWLDVGGVHSLHLTGTFKNGTLKTTAFVPGPDTWVFESTKSVRQTGSM